MLRIDYLASRRTLFHLLMNIYNLWQQCSSYVCIEQMRQIERLRKLIVRHFREFVPLLVLAFVPVLILIQGLVATNNWQDSTDAWLGKYRPFGFPVNPWVRTIVPVYCGITTTFVVFSWCGLVIVRYFKPFSQLYRLRLVIGLLLDLLGAIAYFVLIVFASVAWAAFADVKGAPGPAVRLPVLIVPSFLVLILNIYRTLNANQGSSARVPTSTN